MLFQARWARRLSWKGTAEAFRTSWDKVLDAVEHVVTWGLEHRTLGQIDAIGVDETGVPTATDVRWREIQISAAVPIPMQKCALFPLEPLWCCPVLPHCL